MLPYLVARHVGLVCALHNTAKGFIIVSVELGGIEAFGPFFDQGIVVICFFEVQVILSVVLVGRDELPADRFMDLPQNSFHMCLQVFVRFIAAQFGNHWIEKAESVAQFFRGRSHGGVNVAGG